MDRSNRVFAPATSNFSEAFPMLEDALFRYTEYDFGNEEPCGVFSLRRDGGLLRCRNPRCERGGYEIDHEVHLMMHSNLTERQVNLHCRGDEGTPKGHRRGKSCPRSVKGTITIKYKQSSP